ncbi:MAG: hypothetical protein KDE58_42845, partial [Caldilineaceae bacterium]|nr:hypothetical protein [Caldilineaceae bacterium]
AALLAAPQSTPPEILLTLLLNDLALLTTPVLVLLDDYHLIETPAIHEAMTLLIEQLPAMVHFVILSRTDPPLPLARWRVRGYLCEIRAADLRFTASEIAQFFATSMARPLSPATLQLLRERTEGWIAALQLAALSLQHQDDVDHFLASFGGSQRHLVDYLVDEVFRLQPPPIQAFLLATAVLDRFCADLCRAVLHKGVGADSDSDGDGKDKGKGKGSDQSREDTQALLETLERSNLFLIPLDGERRWYRYHALFAEFLRHRLGGEAAIYHRRAADWYKAAGFVEESIDHLLAAADLDAAAAEIAVHGLSFTLRHQLSTVERWLTQLPTPMRQQQLGLVLCELWLVLGSGNLIAMEEALARAERVATARARDAVPPSPEQLGEYAAAHALVASFRQDHATTIRSARQALDRLPPSAAQLRITVSSGLGYGYYCAGDLRRAESTLRNALQLSRPEYVVTHVTLLGMLAMAIELQGRMAEAVTLYRTILAQAQLEEVTEQQSKPRYLPNPSVLLALHGLALRLYEFNQLDEATALLAQAVTLSTAAGNQMIQGHALATQPLVHQAR